MIRGRPCGALREALKDPSVLDGRSPSEWSAMVASARECNLLGALAAKCESIGQRVPDEPARHMRGALQLSIRQRQTVTWEIHQLDDALAPLDIPVVLLKGAAYVVAGFPLGRGRLFGDIDLLVPRPRIGEVERRLLLNGWTGVKMDPYDQRYYREWMHELPPLMHVRRGTVVDVHHTILPLTARRSPDPARILARSRPVAGFDGIRVPSPQDLVIHSLTHLMHEGELNNGLRDLHDIDEMLRLFGRDAAFWEQLAACAVELRLEQPVAAGLRLAQTLYDTPVPGKVIETIVAAGGPIPRWHWPVFARALEPAAQAPGLVASSCRLAVFVRAHALRMPPGLLLRHLCVKAWRAVRPIDAVHP